MSNRRSPHRSSKLPTKIKMRFLGVGSPHPQLEVSTVARASGAENELLEVQVQNGRWLHPRFGIGAGVLGSRPASVLLAEIPRLQEQGTHHHVSLHEMRGVGIVRGHV